MEGQSAGRDGLERWGSGSCRALPGLWNFKQMSHMIGYAYSLESGRQGWRQEDQMDRGGLT